MSDDANNGLLVPIKQWHSVTEMTLDIPLYEFEKTSATGGLTGHV